MAKLHIDSLTGKRTASDVRKALDNLPTEVNETYDEAMKRIQSQKNGDDVKLAERVLSWITYSRRPLSYRELQHALAVTPQMTDMITGDLVNEYFLIDICAGLVVIDSQSHIIRLARK
jgi:predicted transcriptional regulator